MNEARQPDDASSEDGGARHDVAPAPLGDDRGLVGHVLAGRYHLKDALAEGGMATVYVAVDQTTERTVAVKVMHPELTRERGFSARFKREAVIAGKLDHPSIVRVLDHGEDGHLFFLVMELLDGSDIFDVLRRKKRLDEAVARRIVIDVCHALAVAHDVGIVHRDLKPENVYLQRAGAEVTVKVLDFGVAKMVLPDDRSSSDEADTALTAVGTLLGTPEYLSPEMCMGDPVGPAADLYACGVLLYALLAGRPPFVTERPIDVTRKHISEEPLPPSWFVPGLDPRLDTIVLQALAKKPEDRPANARALADALAEIGPTGPLSPSLLEGVEAKHSATAPTLAVPVVVPRSIEVREAAAPDDTEITSRSSSGPATVRTRPESGVSAARVVLAAIVLAATFAAGFAAGRMSATPVPGPAPVPAPRGAR